MTPALEAVGVTVSVGAGPLRRPILQGVDLRLDPGEVVGLWGDTSAGKTTLIHTLAGWVKPDAGEVRWVGRHPEAPDWREVSVVPQALALMSELSVRDNVALPLRLGGFDDDHDAAVQATLEALGLGRLGERAVDEVSVGERQRVMVARALVVRPRVVLADEPTAHQDPATTAVILSVLRQAAAEGTACLLATRTTELAASADRALRLDGGRVAVASSSSFDVNPSSR